MFRGSYQKKLLTILYSGGSNPLDIWSIQVKNGWTRRVKDEDMGNIVFEIAGTNVATAYIVSPPDPRAALGISLPFITMYIKNLKRYFTFEIQILDDKQMRRRFRFSNYQSTTKVRPFACSVPLALKPGWNQMQLNLANFTMRAYGTNYMETQRVQIHANCRIRRVYFSNKLYTEEELPREYRIYLNLRQSQQLQAPPDQPRPSLEKVTEADTLAPPILKQSAKDIPAEMVASETVAPETLSKKESHATVEESGKDPSKKSLQSLKERLSKTISKSGSIKEAMESEIKSASKASLKSVGRQPSVEIPPITEEGAVLEEGVEGEIPTEQVMDAEGPPPETPTAEPETAGESELETPRTEVTDSEYQESEPVPDSEVEDSPRGEPLAVEVTEEQLVEEPSPEVADETPAAEEPPTE